jgi:uncharacterized protein (DUF302 family)
MFKRLTFLAAAAIALAVSAPAHARPSYDYATATPIAHRTANVEHGLERVQSAYTFEETISRIRADVAAKGIPEFAVIRQSDLARGADIDIRPSALIIFGNPPLGTLFLSENQNSGIDWPVRVLVYEDEVGQIWTVHNDFQYLGRRYKLHDQAKAINMADEVIHSILSTVQ